MSRSEPPPGPPWDAPFDEAPFAFVDLEMTGLDPERDRVCEACIVRTTGKRVDAELESLVLPDARLGGNAAIHGLDADALAGAPSFAELSARVSELLAGAIVVAHAADYDTSFLRAELARAGAPYEPAGVLDTLPLSRRCFALPSHRLSALAESLPLSLPRPHRAGDDARATMELFFRIAEILRPATPRDLFHVRIGERHARPDVLARALAAVDERAVVRVRYRPARRAVEDLAMVLTDVRTDKDPPRILGYMHPGRGRRELRADRILAICAEGEGERQDS